MWNKLWKLLGTILILCYADSMAKRQWVYEALMLNATTSDPTQVEINGWIHQLANGDYVYSGSLNVTYVPDEKTMVEIITYRSETGLDEDYKRTPFGLPKVSYNKFIEKYFIDVIYKNVQHCSNMPEVLFPWKYRYITFTDCHVEAYGMPELTPLGYYWVVIKVTGSVEWGISATVLIKDADAP